jgi:hypothetical protein
MFGVSVLQLGQVRAGRRLTAWPPAFDATRAYHR